MLPTLQQVAWQAAADVAARSGLKPWQFEIGETIGKSSTLHPVVIAAASTPSVLASWASSPPPPSAQAAAATSASENSHDRACRADAPPIMIQRRVMG